VEHNEFLGKVESEMISMRLLSLPPWITNSGCVQSHMSIEYYLKSIEAVVGEINLEIISTKKIIDLRRKINGNNQRSKRGS